MVNSFIRKLITKLSSTVFKSAFKAYENTVKNSKGGGNPEAANPFKKYFEQFSQQNPMAKKVMLPDEAKKILNMEGKDLDPEKIMETYTKMFAKNDPAKGGSFYLQSKVWAAKEELMKEFPGAEQEYYKKHEIEDPTKGKGGKDSGKVEDKKKEDKASEGKEGEEKKEKDEKEGDTVADDKKAEGEKKSEEKKE